MDKPIIENIINTRPVNRLAPAPTNARLLREVERLTRALFNVRTILFGKRSISDTDGVLLRFINETLAESKRERTEIEAAFRSAETH